MDLAKQREERVVLEVQESKELQELRDNLFEKYKVVERNFEEGGEGDFDMLQILHYEAAKVINVLDDLLEGENVITGD